MIIGMDCFPRLCWLLLLLPGWVRAAEPAKPFSGVPELGAGYLAELVVGLGVVLAGIVALAWLLKRLNRLHGSAGGALKVVDGLALGTRERVVLIQVGEEQILVGVAPGRVEALHVLAQPVAQVQQRAPTAAADGGFAERLARLLARDGKVAP